MLLRFGVSNHLSIRDYQEISFVASSLKDRGVDLIKREGLRYSILPAIGIYGANASGKSNVLGAFSFFRSGILGSHSEGRATKQVPREPFRLDPKWAEKESQFDCDFIADGVRYHYGVILNSERIMQEWLYAYPSRQRQVWFHRKNGQFYFGKSLKGPNRTIETLTRSNSFFISSAAQNNHEQLSSIYKFFEDNFVILFLHDADVPVDASQYFESTATRDRILKFLKLADTGIIGARLQDIETPDAAKPFIAEMEGLIKKHTKGALSFNLLSKLKTVGLAHAGSAGEVYLEPANESRGTRRLLSILGPIFGALDQGKTVVIDELESSLHTIIARGVLALFSSRRTNLRNGQILFTTHDTNLLCSGALRRDQIWFTEKDRRGATHLYPLTDIRTRNTDNLERGYLQGRFGAVPFLANSNQLEKIFGP